MENYDTNASHPRTGDQYALTGSLEAASSTASLDKSTSSTRKGGGLFRKAVRAAGAAVGKAVRDYNSSDLDYIPADGCTLTPPSSSYSSTESPRPSLDAATSGHSAAHHGKAIEREKSAGLPTVSLPVMSGLKFIKPKPTTQVYTTDAKGVVHNREKLQGAARAAESRRIAAVKINPMAPGRQPLRRFPTTPTRWDTPAVASSDLHAESLPTVSSGRLAAAEPKSEKYPSSKPHGSELSRSSGDIPIFLAPDEDYAPAHIHKCAHDDRQPERNQETPGRQYESTLTKQVKAASLSPSSAKGVSFPEKRQDRDVTRRPLGIYYKRSDSKSTKTSDSGLEQGSNHTTATATRTGSPGQLRTAKASESRLGGHVPIDSGVSVGTKPRKSDPIKIPRRPKLSPPLDTFEDEPTRRELRRHLRVQQLRKETDKHSTKSASSGKSTMKPVSPSKTKEQLEEKLDKLAHYIAESDAFKDYPIASNPRNPAKHAEVVDVMARRPWPMSESQRKEYHEYLENGEPIPECLLEDIHPALRAAKDKESRMAADLARRVNKRAREKEKLAAVNTCASSAPMSSPTSSTDPALSPASPQWLPSSHPTGLFLIPTRPRRSSETPDKPRIMPVADLRPGQKVHIADRRRAHELQHYLGTTMPQPPGLFRTIHTIGMATLTPCDLTVTHTASLVRPDVSFHVLEVLAFKIVKPTPADPARLELTIWDPLDTAGDLPVPLKVLVKTDNAEVMRCFVEELGRAEKLEMTVARDTLAGSMQIFAVRSGLGEEGFYVHGWIKRGSCGLVRALGIVDTKRDGTALGVKVRFGRFCTMQWRGKVVVEMMREEMLMQVDGFGEECGVCGGV